MSRLVIVPPETGRIDRQSVGTIAIRLPAGSTRFLERVRSQSLTIAHTESGGMVLFRGRRRMQDSSIQNARIHTETTVNDVDFRHVASSMPGRPLRSDTIQADSVSVLRSTRI